MRPFYSHLRCRAVASISLLVFVCIGGPRDRLDAQERTLDTFQSQKLCDTYFSEGANAGDLNRDGHVDVVYGPFWYAGPDFKKAHEIYPPKPQNMEGYADHFFHWVYDFNGDGWNDVFIVGFPGTPAFVYENPASPEAKAWPKHQVFESVGNESPHFIQLVGDDRPELVCTLGGAYGFATIDWNKPFERWTFHRISDEKAPDRFGHGLGVGDLNGDQRMDVLFAAGWFEQPAEHALDTPWKHHAQPFSDTYGGAEMHAYDVDGDGDQDVITSLAAHDFGLAWYEQTSDAQGMRFTPHLIMGEKPSENRYGLVFSELHSVALADIDGDGLKDIVTGKTYYSHHRQSPMWDAGAVVYWFRLERTKQGVNWIPYRADGEAGIGRQVSVVDVNQDQLPDIVVGGMRGSHVLLHQRQGVSEADWQQAQPSARGDYRADANQPGTRFGPPARVEGALEAETLVHGEPSEGRVSSQNMRSFKKDQWSNQAQLFWTGAKPGARLVLDVPVNEAGSYELIVVFTRARDYGIVDVSLDGEKLQDDIDLFHATDVVTSGELRLGRRELKAGNHPLTLEIKGINPAAVPGYMVGIDYIRLAK